MTRAAATIAMTALLTSPLTALAQTPAPTAAAPSPAPIATPLTPEQAEIAAVKPNVAKVNTRPKWISGPKGEIPEAEKAAGHHGRVAVTGVLGADGRLRFATVSKSSGAPVLDAIALEITLASVFEPARDADGAALAIPITIPAEFYNYKSDKPGGGLVHYRCGQFVADMDWWRATFPTAKWGDQELYVMMLGVGTLARMRTPGFNVAQLKEANADFERRFVQAIEDCRRKPEKRFVDMLQPEGTVSEALAKAAR